MLRDCNKFETQEADGEINEMRSRWWLCGRERSRGVRTRVVFSYHFSQLHRKLCFFSVEFEKHIYSARPAKRGTAISR